MRCKTHFLIYIKNVVVGFMVKNLKSTSFLKIRDYFTYNLVNKSPRIWELDFIRGIILLIVTFDHCCLFSAYWNVMPYTSAFGSLICDFTFWYCDCAFRKGIEPFGLFLLCFLSGINCSFTNNGLRRVLKFWLFTFIMMAGYALLRLFIPNLIEGFFIFNIIQVLTISFTVWYFLDQIFTPVWVRFILASIIICVGLTYFYMHFVRGNAYIQNPLLALLVYNSNGYLLSPNNFEPLFPHLGFFIIGGILGKYLYPNKKTLTTRTYPPRFLSPLLLLGKHYLAAFVFAPVIILGISRIILELIHLFI